MKSPKHVVLKGTNYCRRCGLGRKDNKCRCPPGYWMTWEELRDWEAAKSNRGRDRVEMTAVRRRATQAPGNGTKEGGTE